MRLSEAQRFGIRNGRDYWQACRDSGTNGTTMDALARRGLAEVQRDANGRGMEYRLTPAGNALRVEWAIARASRPVEHTPVRVRCTHCGEEFPDGTPGGSCSCGAVVEAVA